MKRIFRSFHLQSTTADYQKYIHWAAANYQHVAFLSSSQFNIDCYSQIDAVLAVGVHKQISGDYNNQAFKELKHFTNENKDWMFGFLSYDLKNQLENLKSTNFDGIDMPLMHFFIPEILFLFQDDILKIGIVQADETDELHNRVYNTILSFIPDEHPRDVVEIKHRVRHDDYIKQVNYIKDHIQRGDIYEANYCIEFYGENAKVDPVSCFLFLNKNNPAPFACFYKYQDKFLISSSPERFLAKRGNTLISQPIKGTIKRGQTPEEDQLLRDKLYNDPKERSENVMIVDLVRNDLSKTAQKGSVKVKELFGIYSYTYVHQMISTIESKLRDDIHFVDALKSIFPMGSMTGAPKIRAMQIMEECESTRRGLYSGAVGYVTPDQDFDFNVIIRSILYNQQNHYVSFMAGSAITIASDPENEYSECLLKAASMVRALHAELK